MNQVNNEIDLLKKTLIGIYEYGNVGLFLERVREVLIPDLRSDLFKDLINQRSRFNGLEKSKRDGEISLENYHLQLNQLRESMLDLLSRIEPGHVDITMLDKNKINAKIFLVTKNSEAYSVIEDHFQSHIFSSVNPVSIDDFDFQIQSNDKELVVIANPAKFEDNSYQQKIKKYLDESKNNIIFYYGSHNKMLESYPEQVYASNSIFSLQSRIKELLEFLRNKNK